MKSSVRSISASVVLLAVMALSWTAVSAQSSVSFTVSIKSVFTRSAPSWSATRTASLFSGQSYPVNGRNADSTWVRISVTGIGNETWVAVSVGEIDGDLESVPVVAAGASGVTAQATPLPTAAPRASVQPPAAPVGAPRSVGRGNFELGGQVAGFGDNAISAMRQSGMTWIKRQVQWSPGESASGPSGVIAEAHGRGFHILLSVKGSPGTSYPQYFSDFARFSGELAAAGADAIEVWNEQNIDREWAAGQISPATYTSLLQQAFGAIKAANPGTVVVSGAPAPTGYFGGCSPQGCDDAQYIAGMVAAGALNYLDCLGIHYNEGLVRPSLSSGDPRGNPNHYTRYYQTMVDTYYGLSGGRRPLCFTEMGYLSGEEWGAVPAGFLWKPPYNLTVAEHADYLAEAVRLSRQQGKIRLLLVFNVDFTVWGDDPMAGYAMIRPGGGCPACATLAGAMSGN